MFEREMNLRVVLNHSLLHEPIDDQPIFSILAILKNSINTRPSAQYIYSAQELTKQLFLCPRITSMTNFRIKYTSYV